MMYVLNLNFPKERKLVLDSLEANGVSWPMGFLANAEPGSDIGYWSAPKRASAGDTCLVMCAKSARERMRQFVRDMCAEFGVTDLTGVFPREWCAAFALDANCAEMWSGMIVGWATLTGDAVYEPASDGHWGSRIYAPMGGWSPIPPGVSLLGMEPLVKINSFGGVTILTEQAEPVVRRMCGMD